MQTLMRALCLAAIAVASVACASKVPFPSSATPPANEPLVSVTTRGGECVGGPCGSTATLDRDGRVHLAAKPPNDLGTVPLGSVRALEALIAATDFAAIKAHPFAGQCPTAFDGQEYVFEFVTPGGVQRIASCEVAIDWGSPLFVAVSTAFGPFVPLPTT